MKKKRVKSAVIIAAVVMVAAGICFAPYIKSGRLIAAVRSQDYAKMEKMLDSGVDPNTANAPD